MDEPKFDLARVVSAPFDENTYLLRLKSRNDCLVIDPGFEPDQILAWLDTQRVVPAAILNTHGHSDHIAGNAALKRRWPECPMIIGDADARQAHRCRTESFGSLRPAGNESSP